MKFWKFVKIISVDMETDVEQKIKKTGSCIL